MTQVTPDPAIDFVLEQIETMVASEGGSLALVEASENRLTVRYTPGVNKECPECVPTHEQVSLFLQASLKIHAPGIKAVEVV